MADRLAAFQQKKDDQSQAQAQPQAKPEARTAGGARDLTRAKSALFEKKVLQFWVMIVLVLN